MLVDSRAQIERRDPQVRWCEPEAHERVDDRERLNCLLRVEVVAFRFVGEIEPRPDDGDAVDTACGERPRGYERRERLFDREVWQERRVGREAAIAKELRPSRELGAGPPRISLTAASARNRRLLQRRAASCPADNDERRPVPRRPRIDAAAFDQPARERRRSFAPGDDAGDEVADARAGLAGAFPAAELRAVVQRARLPGERRAEEEKLTSESSSPWTSRARMPRRGARPTAGQALRSPPG
jgi:hypothetical protein